MNLDRRKQDCRDEYRLCGETEKDRNRVHRHGNIYSQDQRVSEQWARFAHSGKTTLRSMLSKRRQSTCTSRLLYCNLDQDTFFRM